MAISQMHTSFIPKPVVFLTTRIWALSGFLWRFANAVRRRLFRSWFRSFLESSSGYREQLACGKFLTSFCRLISVILFSSSRTSESSGKTLSSASSSVSISIEESECILTDDVAGRALLETFCRKGGWRMCASPLTSTSWDAALAKTDRNWTVGITDCRPPYKLSWRSFYS